MRALKAWRRLFASTSISRRNIVATAGPPYESKAKGWNVAETIQKGSPVVLPCINALFSVCEISLIRRDRTNGSLRPRLDDRGASRYFALDGLYDPRSGAHIVLPDYSGLLGPLVLPAPDSQDWAFSIVREQ
jgi:hypothetical protein